MRFIDPLGLAACGDNKDCIQRCLEKYYGSSYEQAKDYAPFAPLGWAWGEYTEWVVDRGKAQGNRDMYSGKFNQGKRIARGVSALKGISAVSSVIGAAAGGYVVGAWTTCAFRCEFGDE